MRKSRINVDLNNTTYNLLFKNNTKKIEDSLHKYVNSNMDLNLEYEFKVEGNTKLVFITGFNKDELELPFFDNPVIIQDLKNRDVVCTDLRRYSKKVTEQPLYLSQVYKDKASFDFIINRSLLIAEFVNGNFNVLKTIDKNLCSAFSLLFSSLLNYVVSLNPVEKVHVEIVLAYYFYTMTIEEEDIGAYVDTVIAKISKTELSLPVGVKEITPIVNKLIKVVNTNEDFVNNIRSVLEDDKQLFINMQVFINTMSNMWYGPTGDTALIIGLENYPTFITLVNSALNDKTYSRCRLAMILTKYNKKIKHTEVDKAFELFQKERTI